MRTKAARHCLAPFLPATACIAVTALSAAGAEIRAEPFAFRGIALGTSLADLRRIQFPEAPGARILCSHDAEASEIRPIADTSISDEDARAGSVVCGAYTFEKALGPASQVLPPEWLLSRLDVGAIEAAPVFWFVPENGGETETTGRLYRIAMRSNSAYFPATRAAFIRRYGPPTEVKTEKLRQEGKRDLPFETVTWTNAQSSIRLTERDQAATRMTIAYEHTALKP